MKIVEGHYSDAEKDTINETVTKFLKLRKEIPTSISGVDKQLSTSELIDWFKIIYDLEKKDKDDKETLDETETKLLKQWNDSKGSISIIPFYQILIKNFETRELYLNQLKKNKDD